LVTSVGVTRAGSALKVAVGGLGTIGLPVARALDSGIHGLELAAVSARDRDKAARNMADFANPVPVLGLAELAGQADIVVESAPAAVFAELAEAAVEAGRILVTVSCGALLDRMDLVERARETGARIVIPTGALLGLDAVRAAAEGTIHSARMVTRKPPASLAGAPYLAEQGIDLEGLSEARKIFEGTAREGARGFPANVNVAAALSLAGVGPDETRLEIWADPAQTRNAHKIVVEAEAARFEMQIENVPSEENPRTGKLTPLSVIAALRGLTSTLKAGT
jgi:aspartate dehydrogenase